VAVSSGSTAPAEELGSLRNEIMVQDHALFSHFDSPNADEISAFFTPNLGTF
jgi:hypothetical protein